MQEKPVELLTVLLERLDEMTSTTFELAMKKNTRASALLAGRMLNKIERARTLLGRRRVR